jgi:hypothetical protein
MAGSRFEPNRPSPAQIDGTSLSEKPLEDRAMGNTTIPAADRATHAKIVAIAFAASGAVLLVAMMARTPAAADLDARMQAGGPAVRAGEPAAISRSDITAIR